MEPLRLKPLQLAEREPEIENWDDDDFFEDDGDDLAFRSSTNSNRPVSRRDSVSSHRSMRSELESLQEEERQVHVPDDDENSTMNAIATAANMGIPIPHSVPPSALVGGTIKRLGGRKIKKIIEDDWGADLEFPEAGKPLVIKPQDASGFPDAIRHVSAGSIQMSPTGTKQQASPGGRQDNDLDMGSSSFGTSGGASVDLDKFRDVDDDDDFFGDGSATIRVSKTRGLAKPISLITPPTPQKSQVTVPQTDDDFEMHLELPSDGKLKLSTKKDIPKTPSSGFDDLDWGEGSLGTRYGGTRRDGRSNRSSSASALSPSISSSITAESEDETLDGLVLPPGPVNFEQRLKLRRTSRSPQRIVEEEEPSPQPKKLPAAEEDKEDFFTGLDLGDAAAFDSRKFTVHRNIKIKDARPESPSRPKTSASITFTNKPVSQHQSSRLPRLSHERTQSSLEPVSETGDPILPRLRRSQSRIGHSAHSSVSSLPTPTTPCSSQSLSPLTPRRVAREMPTKTSTVSLRNEPTTTSAQLLRLKRSMPAMKGPQSPAKTATGRFERPLSRSDAGRPQSALRSRTPVDHTRQDAGSSTLPRRHPPPSLPAGSSHLTAKGGRVFRRYDSDNAIDFRPSSRGLSRSTMRSPSPRARLRANEKYAETNYRRLHKPRHQRTFGEGSELDGFDDLPVSRDAEARFVKQPVPKDSKPAYLRNKLYQNVLPDRGSAASPVSPYSPIRQDYTPSFARDTAASRIAREVSLAQRAPSQGPLAPLTAQRVAQLSTRGNLSPNIPPPSVRSRKHSKRPPQLKPHLISNLNSTRDTKTLNGMVYNPATFRWEGNENDMSAFDAPASSPSTASLPPYMIREKENATPRPALITNISSTKGVQVVGEMVFDPQNMCWLKIGATSKQPVSETGDPLEGFNGLEDDDEDVFKDIPDLEENTAASNDGGQGRMSDMRDDWLVGEEFDVGPEFIRRQREEEDRWRKKCESWLSGGSRDHDAWRWTIRELVSGDANF